ncbi:Wzz/FepE/Etk N-terminal domain-containing protein [Vibrio sp. 10N.286.49.B3]|uniref:Wzz/FepE/Etk N-terminal domain-containing protein n=1 Tax=Vibrio sp. 10N.286.49.B3 TaxID=1880855 RepID=UPI0018E4C40A|nr:Wzz/FepE/Etk N-terminal domain-containing protein [Vibrio sp. 10N.286.49.B3]
MQSTDRYTMIKYIKKKIFLLIIVVPLVIFSIYQLLLASPRYESKVQLTIQQPDGMSTMDPSMALLSGLGVANNSQDIQLVQSYIHSSDMLNYLEDNLSIKEHYTDNQYDIFSRLSKDSSYEDFYQYYQQLLTIEIDEKSSTISVYAQAFEPILSYEIVNAISERSEWFINNIGHQLAEAQLTFIKKEHQEVEVRLQSAQKSINDFQNKHNLLDPETESMALSQISYSIEGEIAKKNTELTALQALMADSAPQVLAVKNELNSLKSQLIKEKSRLTDSQSSESINNVLSEFANLKIDLELAIRSFTSSTVSMEKSRIEAYRQLKFLIVVDQAKVPEKNKYPEVFYNISLLALLLIIFSGTMKIVFATINELK